MGCVRVCPDAQTTHFISPNHQLPKVRSQRRLNCWQLPQEDAAGRPVDRNPFTLCNDGTIYVELLLAIIDIDFRCAANAGLTHSARDYSSVTCHSTPGRHDRLCGHHTVEIIWTCFLSYQNDLYSLVPHLLCFVSV